MFVVSAADVARAVREALPRLACVLPGDVCRALHVARAAEENPRGRAALETLCANAQLAATEGLPLCQDTGTVRVWLEIGADVSVAGDVFSGVDAAVAEVYTACGFRASVVKDALFDRTNTGANAPAFCRLTCTNEPGVARLHLMLKGGGSDNASRVVMLAPSAGRAGVVARVLRVVREKAANACPPLVVGVGVGATFDAVAELAFGALMRPVGTPAASKEAAALETELTEAIRATGIGAGAQGGAATALAVHVQTAPCHIAALPLAVEMGCSAMRRCTIDLTTGGYVYEGDEAAACEIAEYGEGGDGAACEIANAAMRAKVAGEVANAATRANAPLGANSASNDLPAPIRLTLPLDPAALTSLHVGDACLLTGDMYTLRDAGHARLVAELDACGTDAPLPYGLNGATIFYAGPTPPSPTHPERPFGAVGPTTASRMDAFAPRLYAAGVRATIGKGTRGAAVAEACAQTGGVYFTAIGGAAALLGACVTHAQTVAYADLGTEALRRITVQNFPVTVAIDAAGNTQQTLDCEALS